MFNKWWYFWRISACIRLWLKWLLIQILILWQSAAILNHINMKIYPIHRRSFRILPQVGEEWECVGGKNGSRKNPLDIRMSVTESGACANHSIFTKYGGPHEYPKVSSQCSRQGQNYQPPLGKWKNMKSVKRLQTLNPGCVWLVTG